MSEVNHIKYLPESPDYKDFAVNALKAILLDFDKDNPRMRIRILMEKFYEHTGFSFDIYLKKDNFTFEQFINKYYFKDFKFENDYIQYKAFEDITKFDMLRIPKFPKKAKYVTCPLDNQELHQEYDINSISQTSELNNISKVTTKNDSALLINFREPNKEMFSMSAMDIDTSNIFHNNHPNPICISLLDDEDEEDERLVQYQY